MQSKFNRTQIEGKKYQHKIALKAIYPSSENIRRLWMFRKTIKIAEGHVKLSEI